MKKILIVTSLLLLSSFSVVNAETDPAKCFDMGFATAVKAYNAGDKSMFDISTGGMSATAFKKSSCCQNYDQNPFGCIGYGLAFKAVLLGGPSKNTYQYQEQYNAVKMLQLGF